jgi:hypothetical protein
VGPKQDNLPHPAASTAEAFRSGLPGTGDKLSFASATASVYAHSCSLRQHTTGTIVVVEATGGNEAP